MLRNEADVIFAAPQAAEVRQAFDEERALAEIREQMVRKGAAKGEFQDAILVMGQTLTAARRAMPGAPGIAGRENFSAAFLAFVARAGIKRSTAKLYMFYARNPDRLTADRKIKAEHNLGRTGRRYYRAETLSEIRDALLNASKEEVLEAINQELADGNAKAAS